MMNLLMYAGIAVAGIVAFRLVMRRNAAGRALKAVGRNVALVTPGVQPDGAVELKFIMGQFELIDANFYLRLPSDEAFVVPGPLLVKLKANPAPELFDGAAYLLRLDEEEAKQLRVLAGTELEPQTPVN